MKAMQSGYDINDLFQEAQSRWLKPAEVLFILQNHEKYKLTQEPPKKPTSGSLLLYNKRILRFFRRDGHNWRKKKDGRTVGEAHERLKVGNVETLNCYYAHGEENPSFQRRSYWILDPAYEHIVLVHYRDITEGNSSSRSGSGSGSGSGSATQLSPESFLSFSQSPSPSNTQNAGSLFVSDYQSYSPGSIEVTSDSVIQSNGNGHYDSIDGTGGILSTTQGDVNQALRKLEVQLSLNEDSVKDFESPSKLEDPNDPDLLEYENQMYNPNTFLDFNEPGNLAVDQCYSGFDGVPGDSGGDHRQLLEHEHRYGGKESVSWKEMLDSCNISSGVECQNNHALLNGTHVEYTRNGPTEEQEYLQWQKSSSSIVDNASSVMCQEVDHLKISSYPSSSKVLDTNSEYYAMLFDQGQTGPLESGVSLTTEQKQKFTIHEISPEWGYATEATKIIIVGSFLCDSSESTWHCMFGDVEVPAQIIQDGVLRCEAPPHPSGKVTICITAGNRQSCSEVKEFEYCLKPSSCVQGNPPLTESTRSPEELLLLVRFVQLLLSDSSMPRRDNKVLDAPQKLIADVDSWDSLIESLLDGSGTLSSTINLILEELLKDKLLQWISSRSQEQQDQTGCPLSKKEQGIIHMIAGLGFEWAINPILSSGVSINFRDINGWTALHWAARFGREKMVAALIASGASAGAVTDPCSQDPIGKTAASIAASNGHKGLAGYLAEVALTSHLSSLTLEESELYKGSAEIEAENTINSISKHGLIAHEDQLSLEPTLAAVRNAAQAAARIQSAFRAHSFRKQQKEAIDSNINEDEYGFSLNDISAMSKMKFRNPRDYNSAALSIQKKYRGWKGRKDFLALRQKVVKIQAHVRGYQIRKSYKVICWAVGVLEKVVLRWRRKGSGLRGYRPEIDPIDESEDILKVFRKQKVDGTIKEAFSRVMSMVKSSEARQQYIRVFEKYCQVKAERGDEGIEAAAAAASSELADLYGLEDVDMFSFP
ncbi:calmodulin-binding transcription activator 4 isoform X2 [Cannabis sativa]|uniref:calmodulin-binding transcription activator 4 isoform X2 n=1 Tax=Cannabis sativa TaxID=3483 RepID=UPI0029CA7AE1|nr:calmodulin-binding transcription activator 4 isoform X2 [Cannabis sativa]